MWLIYALLSAFTAALVAIFGKLGLKDIDATFATTIRAIIMAAFLISLTFLLKKISYANFSSISLKDWMLILCSGISGALSWLFYFIALKQGDASHVASVDRLSIAFVVLLAAIILNEKLTLMSIFGTVLMILGSLAISQG
ncbi:EamA family transporter [Candidatus Dependentiae bacterium]|nr:EamA family transporter [Candidatus Dependentiae bacterium]